MTTLKALFPELDFGGAAAAAISFVESGQQSQVQRLQVRCAGMIMRSWLL